MTSYVLLRRLIVNNERGPLICTLAIFYDELYSSVVLFSLIFRVTVRVRVSYRVRVRVMFRDR